MPTRHRPPAVAGRFYPAARAALQAEVQRCLDGAPHPPAGGAAPKLLVVPHAGYVYSGPIAAAAYALLRPSRSRIRRVVLLGPTHRVAVRGAAVPTVGAFDTPLGAVPIDQAAIDRLADLPQVVRNDAVHAGEHALEVQLPFLQTVLERFTLVPLAVGDATTAQVAEVIERLWGGDETLIVISTDLSHDLPYDEARTIDRRSVDRMLAFDDTLAHGEACGATPLNGALRVARTHGLRPRRLDLRNSGDTAGDRHRVVGYAALAYTRAASADTGDRPDGLADPADGLGPALLSRARNAIAGVLRLPQRDEPDHPALWRPGATFVTLHRRGRLRGCIGRLVAERPLHEDVRVHARRAAFDDPRFVPLRASEWPELDVQVSVPGAARAMDVRDEADARAQLQPGADGVTLEWHDHRATFLPQVWAQLPDPAGFLGELKRKAGLRAEFWHDDVRLSRYRVRVYADDGAGR